VTNKKCAQPAGNVELELHNTAPVSDDAENRKTIENKRYAVKTLIIITLFYFACNVPLPVYTIVGMINKNLVENRISMHLVGIFFFIMIANTGLKAVVYMFRTKKIKKYYKQMIWM